jgi:Tfp pilus assembly protein PilF
MVYGGEQKPGATERALPSGPRRGRRSLAAGRSSGVYGLAGLAVLALWGAWSLGVVGCSGPGPGYSLGAESPGSLFANMRQSPEEISRLERNAHYYKLMGQPELGLKEMELAHQENPDNLQITDLLAQNYEELGKFEAARQLYQEALTRQGSHAVLANNLCFSYYNEGRWQEAETCFRQTLTHDPGNAAARNNLGLLFCRLGRHDEARRLWQEAEGVAAADAKMSQALAVLGMPESAVYARKPEPAPPAARVTQAPAPKTAVSRLPAPIPAKPETAAQAVTPEVTAAPVAAKPTAPAPAPVAAKPLTTAPAPVVTKPPAPTPAPVAAKPPAPTPAPVAAQLTVPAPAPVAASPRPEARKQAVVAPKALAAAAPTPVPQAPLAAAELAAKNIELRNGSRTKNLAQQTRSLLQQEGFSVARSGDHQYSGAAKTKIYYRPEAEEVARALGAAVFPEAKLAPSKKLKKGMDILVLLRGDLLENPQFMARLNHGGQPAATDIPATTKTEAGQPPLAAQPLTAAELVETAIEVSNGNGTRNLARNTRSRLCQEGFTVATISNHVDFGAAKTMIYYRPEAEKVARALSAMVFPQAGLEPSPKLKEGMDIKILLGADLLQHPQLMAGLVAGDS